MTYSRAIEILGLTTPKSLAENKKLAQVIQSNLVLTAPLRFKVACKVVIEAAK
jgi:hypothetical protein